MVRVLGLSAFYHDAAAALVENGRIVAAAQEERFSRQKHDPRLPVQAIGYCLEEAEVNVGDLDAVAFYDNPLLTWDRVLETATVSPPAGSRFADSVRSLLGEKIWVQSLVRRSLGGLGKAGKLLTTEHHMAHAASAFYPSPFDRAAILTVDGVGEWATTTVGIGEGERIELLLEIDYPHSLGLMYSAFTYFCGFEVNDGEYKLMGLAPYGRPVYAQRILEDLISVKRDGSYRLHVDQFAYVSGTSMTGHAFEQLFGGPRRLPGGAITQREMNLAASVQVVLEHVVQRMASHACTVARSNNLVMAGGVALNCVANSAIARVHGVDHLWIQPAAGDAGGAAGAAWAVSHQYFHVPRLRQRAGDAQMGSYLGPSFSPSEVQAFLERHDLRYHVVADEYDRADSIAQALAEGKIVGYFNGRMEYGPRALGARSILADPRRPEMQGILNARVKNRESFRPFAPAVLRQRLAEYFDLDGESPYMLMVAPVKCSDIPAVTHVDGSARIQTIDAADNPDFHAVVAAFEQRTGCGLVVNTSFNLNGEPIVCTPRDAYVCFMRCELDLLVLENCLLWKDEQGPLTVALSRIADKRTDGDGPVPAMPEHVSVAIGNVFDEILVSARTKPRSWRTLLRPDSAAASYYVERPSDAVTAETFGRAAYDDSAGLRLALQATWKDDPAFGSPDVIDRIAGLADLLFAARPSSPSFEVSNSLYVIF
jgi:carbamoyltransferase